MSKRFIIVATSNHIVDYNILHECAVDNREQAISAFRTLYNEPQYVLFEQVACSEPAGSCDESEYASGEDSLQSIRDWREDDTPF